ncbi:MAG: hypothetical protein GC201_08475 [Alphaproteobacteria bacterium]|nr:hypothetical protein [Alphaproteobacteria bacterium]
MTDKPDSGAPEQPRPSMPGGGARKGPEKPAPKRKRRAMPWLLLGLGVVVFVAGVLLAPRIIGSMPGWVTERLGPATTAEAPSKALPAEPQAAPPARPSGLAEDESAAADREAQAQSPAPPATEGERQLPWGAPAAGPSAEGAAPPADEAAAGDSSRVAALERRIDDLQRQLQQQRDEAGGDNVSSEIRTLSQQVGQLFGEMVKQVNQLQSLQQDVEASRPSETTLREPLTVLAVSRLRQAVEQGSSYMGALDGVERLVDEAALSSDARNDEATLKAHAKQGVASMQALRDSFADRIDKIITADDLPADASWWERTVAGIKNAVTVRRTGDVEGSDTQSIVARAEAALDRGDLEGALRELQALPPQAALAASDWLERAQTRQAVMGAVARLETAVLGETAQVPAP